MKKITLFLKHSNRYGAWAGMIGPILFIGIFSLEGLLRPDYDPFSMFISELSLGPRGWIQITNFMIFGTLLFLFTISIATEFYEGKASRAGPILFLIFAICLFASGPVVMDPVNTVPEQMSWHGILHNILGAIFFSLSPVSCFVFLRRFREEPKWYWFRRWTIIAGTIIIVAVIVLAIGQKTSITAPNALSDWIGLIQRIALITYLIWLFVFALGLHMQKKRSS